MNLKTSYYQNILKEFDTHIVATKSIKTGNYYTGQARKFLLFLEDKNQLNLNQVNRKIMESYFNHLTTRPKLRREGTLSISTINGNLSTLRMLSKNMLNKKIITQEIPIPSNIEIKRTDEELEEDEHSALFTLTRQILTEAEVKEVFEHCNNNTERSLIAIAYGSGLRRGELATLQDNQVNYSDGEVTVINGKGNKTRTVPISAFFVEVLKNYSKDRISILARLNSRNTNFFMDEKGNPISGDNLNEMLKKIIKRTGNQEILNKKITLHCLRHTISVHLMDAGATFEYVKDFLGHSFIDTSTIYAKRRKKQKIYAI
ncbi:MAG: Tyrosine recombinase XerC [Flavobacteriales bacterium]|nr:Tyrosine recombinase XerC [Flavobacteriales bacterium]